MTNKARIIWTLYTRVLQSSKSKQGTSVRGLLLQSDDLAYTSHGRNSIRLPSYYLTIVSKYNLSHFFDNSDYAKSLLDILVSDTIKLNSTKSPPKHIHLRSMENLCKFPRHGTTFSSVDVP